MANSKELKILAVVVTYNGEPYIRKCLDSLLQHDTKVDVVCVDNGSSDGTIAAVENEYDTIEFIKSPNNLGFGKANNIGLSRALSEGYDYALLLNQDAWVQPDCIEKLIQYGEENPKCGIISPLHLNEPGDALDPKFGGNLNRFHPSSVENLAYEHSRTFYRMNYVNAAVWLIPKRTLLAIGGFNEYYFMYGEDGDYCSRVRQHGFEIHITPLAKAHHARYNHYYKPKPFFKEIFFEAKNWKCWSYETFLEYERPLHSAFGAVVRRIYSTIIKKLRQRNLRHTIAVSLGFWFFLFDLPKAIADKALLGKERAPHFLSVNNPEQE